MNQQSVARWRWDFHCLPKELKLAGYITHRGSLSHSRFRCWGARLLCSRCDPKTSTNLNGNLNGPTTEEYLWTLHGSIESPTGSEFNTGLKPKVSKETFSKDSWIWNSSCIAQAAADVDLLTYFVRQEHLLGWIFALCKAGWRWSWLVWRWQDQELLISWQVGLDDTPCWNYKFKISI